MNRKIVIIFVLLVLILPACEREAPLQASPTPGILTPTTEEGGPGATETEVTAPTNTASARTPIPTDDLEITEPAAGFTHTATLTLPPTATDTQAPTNTLAATNTPQHSATATLPPFDPRLEWGAPDWLDEMTYASQSNWASESGSLPNTQFIQLLLQGGQLLVTGKTNYFATHWFTWHMVSDFYLEAKVNTGTCTGRDAYGLVFRGPPHGTPPGTGYGYVASFSCDGAFMVYRLDDTDPYTFTEIIPWTESNHIQTGSDAPNVMGILAEGSTISLYANGNRIYQFEDNFYFEGRYGVWVMSGPTVNFTYQVDEIAHWDLTIR